MAGQLLMPNRGFELREIRIELSSEVLNLEGRAADGEDELLIDHAGSPDLVGLLPLLVVGAGKEDDAGAATIIVARWSLGRLDLPLF
ncbi:hypothetical protein ACLOJK_006661 [Asimina triloba]